MNSREFLDGLRVGDAVIVHGGGWSQTRSIGAVVKRDKVKIVVRSGDGETTFSARHGSVLGGGRWNSTSLDAATPESIAEIKEEQRRRVAVRRIENSASRLKMLPIADLEAAASLLDPRPSL